MGHPLLQSQCTPVGPLLKKSNKFVGVQSIIHLACLRWTYMPRITYSRLTMKEKPAGNGNADVAGFWTCGRHCTCQCQAKLPTRLHNAHGRGLPATEIISQTHHLCLRSVSNPGTLSLMLPALHRRAMLSGRHGVLQLLACSP